MKLTIITVVFNCADTIEKCLLSVKEQGYDDIEHIVVDADSKDGTVSIIRKYQDSIASFVSEPDEGIYDAMNKGIAIASGDVIAFLNADDFYADSQILNDVVRQLEQTGSDCCYGDIEYVERYNPKRIIRSWKTGPYEPGSFERGWQVPHPAFFVRKCVFERCGVFDTSFRISADYELVLRFLKKHEISWCYLPRVLVKMRTGGTSAGNLRQIIKANIECYRAWARNDLRVNPLIMLRKPLSKLKQYAKG